MESVGGMNGECGRMNGACGRNEWRVGRLNGVWEG